MIKSIEPVPSKIPSLKLSILIILIYLFAIVPLLAGIMYVSVSIGYPLKIIRSNLSESILIAQIFLTTAMIYFFLKGTVIIYYQAVGERNFSITCVLD